jgi:nucleoside-diphosphate kinase
MAQRLTFIVSYFDQQAGLTREYMLLHYPGDGTIEMFDRHTKRQFLKRCPFKALTQRGLFIGATVNVFSRALKVIDFGDELTRQAYASQSGRAIVVIGGDALYKMGTLLSQIMGSNVRVENVRLCEFDARTAAALSTNFSRCFVMECVGESLGEKTARWESLSAGNVNVFDDPAAIDAYRHAAFEEASPTATFTSCAVCIVKPHAVNEHAGTVVQRIIDEGFEITALGAFALSRADAEDFLEVYAGVVPEYKGLVDDLSNGQCWAMEVRAENSVEALRAVCGPHDPEIGRVLFPNCLRSLLGKDRINNAVHATDLQEDGPLEAEFFFKLLAAK